MKVFRLSLAWLLVAAAVSSCASTEVTEQQQYQGENLARPDQVIIHDFTSNPADVPAESSFAAQNAIASTAPTEEQLATTSALGAEVAKQGVGGAANRDRTAGLLARHGEASGVRYEA